MRSPVCDILVRFALLTQWCVVCSLATILQKRTLAPGKLDEIKIKANILGAFRPIVAKVEEAVEEAKEEIKRDTAEL